MKNLIFVGKKHVNAEVMAETFRYIYNAIYSQTAACQLENHYMIFAQTDAEIEPDLLRFDRLIRHTVPGRKILMKSDGKTYTFTME